MSPALPHSSLSILWVPRTRKFQRQPFASPKPQRGMPGQLPLQCSLFSTFSPVVPVATPRALAFLGWTGRVGISSGVLRRSSHTEQGALSQEGPWLGVLTSFLMATFPHHSDLMCAPSQRGPLRRPKQQEGPPPSCP